MELINEHLLKKSRVSLNSMSFFLFPCDHSQVAISVFALYSCRTDCFGLDLAKSGEERKGMVLVPPSEDENK